MSSSTSNVITTQPPPDKPVKVKKPRAPREYDAFVKAQWNKTENFTDNSKRISAKWKATKATKATTPSQK